MCHLGKGRPCARLRVHPLSQNYSPGALRGLRGGVTVGVVSGRPRYIWELLRVGLGLGLESGESLLKVTDKGALWGRELTALVEKEEAK